MLMSRMMAEMGDLGSRAKKLNGCVRVEPENQGASDA